MGAVLTSVGDLGLGDYTRDHARQCRQHLLSAGNRTTTVRRRFRTIIAVFNYGISEHAPEVSNVFSKLRIAHEGTDSCKREPFTAPELRIIGKECRRSNDDIRHLTAMLLDTEQGLPKLWA